METALQSKDRNDEDKTVKSSKELKEHENTSGKVNWRRKVFRHRNSSITDLLEQEHLKTVYNICVSAFILFLLSTVIFYAGNPQVFHRDLTYVRWSFSEGSSMALKMWIGFNLKACWIAFVDFKMWKICRERFRKQVKIVDTVFLLGYFSSLLLQFILTTYLISYSNMSQGPATITVCEQIRLIMKSHSFVFEKVAEVIRYDQDKDEKRLKTPFLKHYTYFLFAPTLIYRDAYPRTSGIRWRSATQHLAEGLGSVYLLFFMIMRILEVAGSLPFTVPVASRFLASVAMASISSPFLLFYVVMHCWPHFTAELLTFGDREFYGDWWNTTSPFLILKRWNRYVYDWNHAYVYLEIQKLGAAREMAMLVVLVISFIAHDYIHVSVFGFGNTLPFLLICSYIALMLSFSGGRTSSPWKIFIMCNIFIGTIFLITTLIVERNARINCPRTLDNLLDYFVPRYWSSSCKLIDYN